MACGCLYPGSRPRAYSLTAYVSLHDSLERDGGGCARLGQSSTAANADLDAALPEEPELERLGECGWEVHMHEIQGEV